MSKASERFAKAQERFASKMGVELRTQEEDLKKAEEFAVINEVYSYTRNIFLVQFKVSKADAAFMDGLSEQKTVSYLVGKRSELELIAQEAVNLLKNDKGFNGDKEYRNSALALVEFFEAMSKKNYHDMIELTRMQAKDQSRLTNEEIKRYNELVGTYNETITLYNLQLMKLTNAFNEENNKLLQKYVPNTGVPKGKVQRM